MDGLHLLLLLLLAFPAALHASSLPDYIHVCNRNVPNIDKCINNSIEILRPKLIQGIPELDVPPIVPMEISEIKLSRGPKGALFEALLHNVRAWGAESFEIRDLRSDLERNIFDVKLFLPRIHFEGSYQLRMNILLFNVYGKGAIDGNFTNYSCNVHMKGNKIQNNGIFYLQFEPMKFRLNVGSALFHLTNLFNGDNILGEATNRILNENSEALLQEIIPVIETSLAKIFTDIANRITLRFKYDDLFP